MKIDYLKKIVLILLISIMLIKVVSAIGISPGSKTVDFSPNGQHDVLFKVLNNDKRDMKVLIYADGELVPYITLYNVLVDFKASEESKEFRYSVKLPEKIEKPGLHEARVIAMELPKGAEASGTFIGATVGVATKLEVRVPYPGKYAEISLEVSEAQVNDTISFVIPVLNFGSEDITKAKAVIDILGPTNERIATIESNELAIRARDKKELTAYWVANVNPGLYYAKATVDYDGNKAKAEKIFGIGHLMIDIIDVNVKNFQLGGVAKFNIMVENKWNEKVKGVYAELFMSDQVGDLIGNFKSTPIDIEAMGKGEMVAYWDTEGIKSGSYDAKIVLHYVDKTTEKLLKAEITIDAIRLSFVGATAEAIALRNKGLKENSVLMLLVLVLIAVNIAWFIYFKRRK